MRVLWAVILINASMFVVEMIGGIRGQSQALQADALDFFGDSVTYALSLWAIGKSVTVRTNTAMFKGISLFVLGLWVLGSTLYRVFYLNSPHVLTMSSIAFLALCANLACVALLMKYRDGDSNVRSVWLCTRNDAIGNVMVMIAAGIVWWVGHAWPDLVAALILAALFINSSIKIIRQAREEKRQIGVA